MNTQGEAQEHDEALLDSISAAKLLGAITPREAAEMTLGRALKDDQWREMRDRWEGAWNAQHFT